MEVISDKPRLARLLDHFSALADAREQWRVAYPLPEMLLLVVCGTIAACDDYDDIRDWGEAHLGFLRRPALPSRPALRRLAAYADEPARPGAVLRLLYGLGGQYRNFRVWVGRLILFRPWLV
jgi:hypothetical protein